MMPELLGDFHFIRPWWLLLLLAIPLVVLIQRKLRAGGNSWNRVLSSELYRALIEPAGTNPLSGSFLVPILVVLVAALSLAGPTNQRLPQPVEVKQDPLVVVLDLSMSMTSEDIQPSRIERAKFKITDILRRREEGLTALVAYAGDAYIVTPLTMDTDTILNLLNSLSPEMMPVRGSNVTTAVNRANGLLDNEHVAKGRILLVTDGIEDFSNLRKEIDSKYSISILGIGSRRDTDSTLPIPAFDENKLRDFAMVAGGQYSTVTSDDRDIVSLLRTDLISETEELDGQFFDNWHDLGYYLLVPLVVLFALMTRKGGLLVVLLVIGVQPLKANWLVDMWVPEETQAVRAYRDGNFETAEELFRDQQSDTAKYNQGNALAMKGELEDAIAAFDEVIAKDPDHEDAIHNRQVLKDFLERQQQQSSESQENSSDEEQQDQEQQAGEGDQNQSDGSQSGVNEQGQQSQQGQSQADQQENDQQSGQADSSREQSESQAQAEGQEGETEEQESMSESQGEQSKEEAQSGQVSETETPSGETQEERELREMHERWLRRVPDDPGSLLQRKFQAESNSRIESGELDRNDLGPAW